MRKEKERSLLYAKSSLLDWTMGLLLPCLTLLDSTPVLLGCPTTLLESRSTLTDPQPTLSQSSPEQKERPMNPGEETEGLFERT